MYRARPMRENGGQRREIDAGFRLKTNKQAREGSP
jgi:hypothetical protein